MSVQEKDAAATALGSLADQILQSRTYSAAVNTALEEVIRMRKIQKIPHFFGSGIWEGNLAEMREDRAAEKDRPARRIKR